MPILYLCSLFLVGLGIYLYEKHAKVDEHKEQITDMKHEQNTYCYELQKGPRATVNCADAGDMT